jgi:biopolymer transport protein ExbD
MAMNVGAAGADDEVLMDINTTPLIDVMLVLIIMLIITIPIQTHAVKLNMPTGRSSPPPAEPEIVRIDVDADGRLGWNGTLIEGRDDLEARLGAAAQQPTPPDVQLRPNRLVPYKVVAMVMASAQRHGLKKIGLIGNEQFLH